MRGAIGILGGTFDPIHHGHLALADAIVQELELERLLLVPSAQPPHKAAADRSTGSQRATAQQRLTMTTLASIDHPRFEVSAIELQRPGRSYTFDTITELQKDVSKAGRWLFVVGIDAFAAFDTWHRSRDLIDLCDFAVISRPGVELDDALAGLRRDSWWRQRLDAVSGWQTLADARRVLQDTNTAEVFFLDLPTLNISSTDIRRRVREGRSIRYLVPDAVRHFIIKEHLYR